MSTGTFSSLPNKGCVKLMIETVEVPVEQDESLLLSTVQSLIPGAHGLYTRENGQRRALTLDTSTGRVCGPLGGWTAQDIYVHIAHGHKHGVNCNMGTEYTKASEIFERNVSVVQKLLASGLGYGLRKSEAKNSPKRASRVKSGFEAQPEEVHISDESDSYVQPQIDLIKAEVMQLTEEKKKLMLRLKEVETELSVQKKENDNLRNTLNEALNYPASEIIKESIQDKEDNGDKETSDEEGASKLITQLQNELEMVVLKNTQLLDEIQLLRVKENASISLDESGFVEAHSEGEDRSAEKVRELTLQLDVATKKIQELTEKDEEMNNLHSVIEDLRSKLSVVEKERNDLEWHMGEHKEWLKNSQEKVSYLEAELQRGVPAPAKPEEIKELEAERARQNEQIWLAHEKIAQLNQTIYDLQLKLTNSQEKLRDALGKDDLLRKAQEEKDKLQWKIGELTQWWNDAKWKIGELECGFDHQKLLLQKANEKINQLGEEKAELSSQLEQKDNVIPTTVINGGEGAFTVRKQPGTERWQLATSNWQDSSSAPTCSVTLPYTLPQFPYAYPAPYSAPYSTPYISAFPTPFLPLQPSTAVPFENRRVWFEIDAPYAKTVFLAGSFLNWEVALLCRPGPFGKHGVWVDLPRGKYEFKFIVEGQWQTTVNYPVSTSEIGLTNNYRIVE